MIEILLLERVFHEHAKICVAYLTKHVEGSTANNCARPKGSTKVVSG